MPLIIGALGGGMKSVMVELSNVWNKNKLAKQVARGMQKTILMDSESTIRKVLSGLIQGENVDEQMDTWNWFMIRDGPLFFYRGGGGGTFFVKEIVCKP